MAQEKGLVGMMAVNWMFASFSLSSSVRLLCMSWSPIVIQGLQWVWVMVESRHGAVLKIYCGIIREGFRPFHRLIMVSHYWGKWAELQCSPLELLGNSWSFSRLGASANCAAMLKWFILIFRKCSLIFEAINPTPESDKSICKPLNLIIYLGW